VNTKNQATEVNDTSEIYLEWRRTLMNRTAVIVQSANQPDDINGAQAIAPSPASHTETTLSPQAGDGTCARCGSETGSNPHGAWAGSFVYATGRVESRFPDLSVEKELAQAIGRAETPRLTDRETLHAVLSKRENRYLVRKLCWVLTIGGIETYILQPRDPADFALLVEAINPQLDPMNHLDVVVGLRGSIAPPEMCNGLMVPVVWVDQMYSFDRTAFIQAVPRPDTIPQEREDGFRRAVRDLFDRIIQLADNAGATDEHRALNFMAVRYPAIYAKTAEEFGANSSLTAVDVRPSSFNGFRKIVDVIFSYTNRNTDVIEKFFVRVDVTEEFPFLVTKLSPYFDR